ncbi:Vacuolar amino acid transporter 7 [Yamadazyma tenuis]|uniref:Amino acid transporter transmembrane domain-containing protein n=1 Tax=Candida tenuis (strain ATCC 10573 / BCRC 21748 / CBS 615 / JCM 9827 / NBRC 10315 / NRRL Y-1498 / VKM Y-70) TaxID=590646 RepID=G3B6U3_CANTC|nr:uncharacterized protein CANTEDRAFT_106246 [Yamadazyma tenuis ATCC 10573]EGV63021.1 hypothetical protein CANTEDRAFT_106246 [Yamadazyma tenuis ATCC 10573]WEJ97160.1 Vacuolar amino acid transporter 7 [Yamadazyma tenuis]
MEPVTGGASFVSSAVSLTKTIIGAGLLSMPLAYSTDGLVFGTFIILLAAATSGFGLFLQAYVSRFVPSGHATFFSVCSASYPNLSVVFDLAIAIQCFGCALSYLVLVGDLMPTIIHRIPHVQEDNLRTFWILASTVITVPLAMLKNLDSLKYTSVLGLVAIAYMSLLVITHFLVGDVPQELKGNLSYFPPNVTGVFSTFSIIVFAFTGHQNMFSIINEAKDKSLKSLTVLVNVAIFTSAALFIFVGLAGYLTFGDLVTGNVILSYPASVSATLGRSCIAFMVLFSFPLMLHPARISVNNIYFWLKTRYLNEPVDENGPLLAESNPNIAREPPVVPLPEPRFYTITVGLLLLGYVLAVSIKSFALVLAIVGATGSTAISFILPGLFGYKLSTNNTKAGAVLKVLSYILVIWGFCVMVLCLYTSLFLNPA